METEEARGWEDEDDEEKVLVDLLIPTAHALLDRRIGSWDALDTKGLGTLAISAAALAGLIASHDTINRFWWIPAVALAVSGGLCIASAWPRQADLGPNPQDFYEEMAGSSPLEVSRQMLAELLASTDRNSVPLRQKAWLYWLGLVVLVLSLVGSIPIILARPS